MGLLSIALGAWIVGYLLLHRSNDGVTWTAGFPTASVPSPADNLFALIGTADTPESRITALEATVTSFRLDRATDKNLQSRLQLALTDLGTGDVTGACVAMQDFLTLVSGKASKKLTPAQAAALTASATGIRALIGC